VPTITFCTTSFRPLVTVRRESLGLPNLPIVFLPHPIMNKSPEQIDALVDGVFQQVVDQLTGKTTTGAA